MGRLIDGYVLAAFSLDGICLGWATSITSITKLSSKAERFVDKDAAQRRIYALERAWQGHEIWWAVDTTAQGVDIRTENAATMLDSTAHMGLPSSSSQREPTMPTKKQTKQPTRRNRTKQPTSAQLKQPTKLLPAKPVMRTTAARPVAASSVDGGDDDTGKPCLCGCGELVAGYLKRGHFLKRKQRLLEVRLGVSPEKVFGRRLAKAMGPWNTSRVGVVTPTTTDYAAIRAALKQ